SLVHREREPAAKLRGLGEGSPAWAAVPDRLGDVRPVLPVMPEEPEEVGDRLWTATIQVAATQRRVVVASLSERQQLQPDQGGQEQEHALRVGLAAPGPSITGAAGRGGGLEDG